MGTLLDQQQRQIVPIVLVGELATAVYATIGAFQILVWNPMAAVPGTSLQEIKSAMSAANEPLVEAPVYVWALAGPIIALAFGIFSIVRFPDLPWAVTRIFLMFIILGTPTYFFASFNPGMSIADAFATSGGDHAPWSKILHCMSFLSLVFLLATWKKKDQIHRRVS